MERFLGRAWRICLWLFIVSSAYSLAAYLIAPLAVLGMFLAFGILLNASVIPSGFAVLLIAGMYLMVKYRTKGLAPGIILISAALVPAVYFGQITLNERSKIVERAEYIAALPIEQANVGSDTTLLLFEDTKIPKCSAICSNALMHRSVTSVVIGYRPRWQRGDILEVAQYREFRLRNDGNCSDADMEAMSAGGQSDWALLYRLAGLCITWSDLDAPPDGLWVFQDENVRDHPRFEFKGRRVEIYHRTEGDMRLLLHYESGFGEYRFFPPMFATGFISSPPSMKTVWATTSYNYGEKVPIKPRKRPVGDPVEIYGSKEVADRVARLDKKLAKYRQREVPVATERLIERVTNIILLDDLFPENAVPAVMKAVVGMEVNFPNIDELEKRDLLRALSRLLFVKPELLVELEPLISRAIDDGGAVMALAVRILSSRTVADRKAYLPAILSGLDDPAAVYTMVNVLLSLNVSVSENDLLRAAKSYPINTTKAHRPYFNFFKLLDKQGQASVVALNHLLHRDDYQMSHLAANRLIRLGRQDMVLVRADLFRESLMAYKPDSGGLVYRSEYAVGPGHRILSRIGLREEAERMLKTKLEDPSLNGTAREQLEIMLGEL